MGMSPKAGKAESFAIGWFIIRYYVLRTSPWQILQPDCFLFLFNAQQTVFLDCFASEHPIRTGTSVTVCCSGAWGSIVPCYCSRRRSSSSGAFERADNGQAARQDRSYYVMQADTITTKVTESPPKPQRRFIQRWTQVVASEGRRICTSIMP